MFRIQDEKFKNDRYLKKGMILMKAKITKVMSIVLAICLMTVIVVPTYATEVDTPVAPNASTETVFKVAEEAPQKVISFLDEYGVNVNSVRLFAF